MTIVATIEARMTSSRLPGKVLLPAGGEPLLGILIRRLNTVRTLDKVVVATTTNATDDPIVDVAERYGAAAFRGSEDDVLGRVAGALAAHAASICVEITADCPLLDPRLVGEAIDVFGTVRNRHRYVANTTGAMLGAPAGQDVQVFTAADLIEAASSTRDPSDREHVSLIFYRAENRERYRPYFLQQFPEDVARRICVTLDYPEDYALLRAAHENFADPCFGADDLIAFCDTRPDLSLPPLARRGLDPSGRPIIKTDQ